MVVVIDLFGIDAYLFRLFCLISINKINSEITCPSYYDIPIWQFLEVYALSITVIIAAWAGLIGITQANKQEALAQKLQKDEFLPILVPIFENNVIYKNGSINIKFKNAGKGIAKNITLFFGSYEEKTGISLAPDKSVFEYNPTGLPLEEIFSNEVISVRYEYEDIYDRTHETIGIEFKLVENEIFVPNKVNWKFVKNND